MLLVAQKFNIKSVLQYNAYLTDDQLQFFSEQYHNNWLHRSVTPGSIMTLL